MPSIGNIAKGFDFLGYHFSPEELSIASITLERALAKRQQLYEQKAVISEMDACRRTIIIGSIGGRNPKSVNAWSPHIETSLKIHTIRACRARR